MDVKDNILQVSEELFNSFGYTAVGVDLISAQAKVSKTSLYRHFGNKNKLIEAVLERRHNRFEKELFRVIEVDLSASKKIEAIVDWHFSWFDTANFKGCMFMHALAEFKGFDENISRKAREHKLWLKSLIIQVLREKDEENFNVDDRAEVIITFLEGMIVRAEFSDIKKYNTLYKVSIKILFESKFDL